MIRLRIVHRNLLGAEIRIEVYNSLDLEAFTNTILLLMAPTFGTLESQNLPAPNVELRTHPGSQSKEVTNYSASTQAQGYTEAPGQAKSLPDDNCSLVSPTALCTPEAEHPPPELNDSQSSAQPNSPTILLVDDNDVNLRLLVAFMKKLRYKYVTAQNGQEAVDSFKENHSQIAIVLMGRLILYLYGKVLSSS